MSTETEIERMVIRLVGDGSTYSSMMNQAASLSAKAAVAIERNSSKVQNFTRSVSSYAQQAIGQLKGLAYQMSSVGRMGLGVVGAGSLPALLGLGGAVGGVMAGGWAVGLASDAENAAISFEVMLGSADKAKVMLTEIMDFAAKTPFEMPGLRQAAQMMMNFGVSQDKIMPTLKALGDVAAGDQNKLNGLAYAYSQTQAAGRLMGQDLMQMVNWGFNPLEEMARKSGKSIMQMREEMSAGKVSAKMVEEAFISASGPGGKFFNMMERQSTTITGLKSTLADTIKMEVTKIGQTLIDSLNIKGLLASTIKYAEMAGPKISQAFSVGIQWLVPKVKAIFGFVQDTIQKLMPTFQMVGSFIGGIGSEIYQMFLGVSKRMGSLQSRFGSLVTYIQTLGNSLLDWATANKELLVNIAAVGAAAYAAWVGIPVVIGLVGAAFALLLNPITLVSAAVVGIGYALTEWTDIGNTIIAKFGELFNHLKEQFGMIVELVKAGEIEAAWNLTVANLRLGWAKFVSTIGEHWINFKHIFAIISLNITNAMRAAFMIILSVGASVVNLLIRAWNKIVPKKMEIPEFDIDSATESIKKLKQEHQDTMDELESMRKTELADNNKPLVEAQKAFDDAQKMANEAIQNNQNKPKGTFGDTLFGQMFGLGGLAVDQINKMLPTATTAATTAGQQVGGAYAKATQASMGAIDAVQAGTTKAYDLLQDYRNRMNVNQSVTQTSTAKDTKPTLEDMAKGVWATVEELQKKGTNTLEIGIAALTGA